MFAHISQAIAARDCQALGIAQLFTVGAMTVGLAAGTFAFDKRAGQHFAESSEAADELAA